MLFLCAYCILHIWLINFQTSLSFFSFIGCTNVSLMKEKKSHLSQIQQSSCVIFNWLRQERLTLFSMLFLSFKQSLMKCGRNATCAPATYVQVRVWLFIILNRHGRMPIQILFSPLFFVAASRCWTRLGTSCSVWACRPQIRAEITFTGWKKYLKQPWTSTPSWYWN